MLNPLQYLARRKSVRKGKNGKKNEKLTCGTCGYLDSQLSGWFNLKNRELLEGFPIGPDDTVIDVGCGDGGAVAFAVKCGANVIGTDLDSDKIARLQRRIKPAKGRTFEGIVSDSNPLPIPDGSASKVICMEVIEHVDDPRQFLSELVRVGTADAQYLITVPDPVAENVQLTVAPPAYWSKPNHVRIIDREEFAQLIENAGLTVEKRASLSFFWAMWWILFWAADQEFGEPESPLLQNWTKTWHGLITSDKGGKVRETLNTFMPKSQAVVARKAA